MIKSTGFLVISFILVVIPDLVSGQGIGVIPDGVLLDATPTVSADRRYVRVGVNAGFSAFNGFDTFPVPAAVGGGGGAVGFGAVGVNNGGQGGLFGPGAAGMTLEPMGYSVGVSPFSASFSRFYAETPAEVRTPAARFTRVKPTPKVRRQVKK